MHASEPQVEGLGKLRAKKTEKVYLNFVVVLDLMTPPNVYYGNTNNDDFEDFTVAPGPFTAPTF